MSEQKEMKNMKNDAAEQQTDAAAFQVVNEGFSTHEAIEEAKRCLSGIPSAVQEGMPDRQRHTWFRTRTLYG